MVPLLCYGALSETRGLDKELCLLSRRRSMEMALQSATSRDLVCSTTGGGEPYLGMKD
ncbi:hypothetical protein Dimus_024004, partial [Dionaea muscipula]